jgi:hypothetical protein
VRNRPSRAGARMFWFWRGKVRAHSACQRL